MYFFQLVLQRQTTSIAFYTGNSFILASHSLAQQSLKAVNNVWEKTQLLEMSYFALTIKINLECKFIMTVTFYVLSSNWDIILEVSFSKPFFFLVILSGCPLLKCNPVLFLSELRRAGNCASSIQDFSDINTVSSQVPSSFITS